jgi:hypothetical protein
MRRLLFPGIPLLLLLFFVAFEDRVPITAGSSSGDRDGADTESLLAVPAEKGTHTITATYSGDSNFNPVTSPPLTQTVQ